MPGLSEGKALCNTGNYSAAAHAFREPLAIAAHSNIDERQLVVVDDALAGTYAEAGQFADAEAEYRYALALVEKGEGQNSLHYALLFGDIAILSTQTGNREKVIARLRQAIAVNAQVGSAGDITVARECLAQILRKEKRYEEAEAPLLDALANLASQKSSDPVPKAAALNNLAMLRFDQERYFESVDLQQQSIREWETALGKEHPSLVAPLNNLATTYVKMARFDDAKPTYQRALKVCSKTLGENHLDYAVLLKKRPIAAMELARPSV